MSSVYENNQRMAKNTLYMYFRMFLIFLVSLYSSRVVINVLGLADYGIFNVMGGIIGMLTYVNTLLSGGTSRFITADLGVGDIDRLRQTFSMANILAIVAAIIILLLGETVGLWFMSNKLNIDSERMTAAMWVYQCALISCCLSVIQTPYTASIVAHEKMNIYAYMSIFDCSMKLAIVFLLKWFDYDKLILYSILVFAVGFLNFIIYRLYCVKSFEECKISLHFDKQRLKEMMTFSGWNMIGAFASVLNNYGLNILLNLFFGTVVNAARGIALQISQYVSQFYSNFQISAKPQVIKYYAQGDVENMGKLIINTSKYCGLLLMCVIIPIIFNIDGILMIWLGQIPQYTPWFVRIILLQIFFQSTDYPLGMGIHAVGKMMLPNITASIFYLSVFPVTYLLFKNGIGPLVGYCVYLCFSPCILLCDLYILHRYTSFSISNYLKTVIIPLAIFAITCSVLPCALNFLWGSTQLFSVLIKLLVDVVYVSAVIYIFALPKSIKVKIYSKVVSYIPCKNV